MMEAPPGVGIVGIGMFGMTAVARREDGRGTLPFSSQKFSTLEPTGQIKNA